MIGARDGGSGAADGSLWGSGVFRGWVSGWNTLVAGSRCLNVLCAQRHSAACSSTLAIDAPTPREADFTTLVFAIPHKHRRQPINVNAGRTPSSFLLPINRCPFRARDQLTVPIARNESVPRIETPSHQESLGSLTQDINRDDLGK